MSFPTTSPGSSHNITDITDVADAEAKSDSTSPIAEGTDPHPTLLNFPQINVQTETGASIDFTSVIIGLLGNPLFTNVIATALTPALSESLSTSIKTSINEAIHSAIKSVQDKLESESQRVDSNEQNIATLTEENNELRERAHKAEERIEDLECKLEELEQYGRRNSLRFHNVLLSDSNNTDVDIVNICKEKLNVDISTDDICRSHPIGRPNHHGKSQIICRFRNWKLKNRVYSKKKLLKDDSSRIFITEDLTHYRQEIISEISKAKRARKVYSFWTNDGRIFIKTTERGPKILISSIAELNFHAPP
ncbi:hypothetical protein FSP39_006965 [Pinctada imbricata]|uniref:Uncharacterized protein n=1 Tax=Pinctada imbricata TaxID=66713 RepID=A0AA88YN59_PINIB|nr:hypothetical protein FSP39_006965 [Pinctada imbricata]